MFHLKMAPFLEEEIPNLETHHFQGETILIL